MTYRKHQPCNFLTCPIKRVIRAMRWALMSKPISWHLDTVREGKAIHKHFSKGVY
jgi:hypothetical protein